MGRPTDVLSADGATTHTRYLQTGLVQREYGTGVQPVEYAYDSAGRMKTMTTWRQFVAPDSGMNSGAAVTRWLYDEVRGLLKQKLYDDADAGLRVGPEYEYTAGGRLQKRFWARKNGSDRIETVYAYDFQQTGSNTRYAGDTVAVSYPNDPLGTPATGFGYDRMGRAQIVTRGGATVTYGYNEAGSVETESNSGGPLDGWTRTITPDSLFRRLRVEWTKTGATAIGQDYGYDAVGLWSSIQADGSSGQAADRAEFDRQVSGSRISEIRHKEGTTLRMTTSRRYDRQQKLSSLASTHVSKSAPVSSVAYEYNAVGQRNRKIEKDGSYWAYGYDDQDQLTSAKRSWADGSAVAGQQFEYAFDTIGNRTSSKSGGDASGQNLRQTTYPGGANLLNQHLGRVNPSSADVVGAALPSATVTVNSLPTLRRGEYFRGEASISASSTPVSQTVSIASTTGGTTTGKLLWPSASETPQFDADGNLVADSLWSYEWDAENRLIRVTSQGNVPTDFRKRIRFDYDWLGRRIQKSVQVWDSNINNYSSAETVTRFVYDGQNLVGQLDGGGALQLSFTWGPDVADSRQGAGGVGGLLSVRSHTGSTTGVYYCTYDGSGNVVGLVARSSGDTAATYEYGPFGEVIRATGPMAALNPIRFSSKYTDDETGLVYYGYRFYSPTAGRWVSRDPSQESGGLNLYGFVLNDPVNRIDPDGLSPVSIILKQGAKKATKGLLRKYIKDRIESKFKDLAQKGAKELIEEAYKVVDTLDSSWWEICIEFVPIGGDIYGVGRFAQKLRDADKKLDELEKKAKALSSAKRGPKPKSQGGPHNEKIEEVGGKLGEGETLVGGGGRKPEVLIPTPGGNKTGRRPDMLVERPDGSKRGTNVGKTKADGTPIKREQEALDDLRGAGIDMDFVPYDR